MTSQKGFVYILSETGMDDIYKIGVTKGTIERRIKKLQTGNPNEIFLVRKYHTEHPFFLEKCLHQKYHNKKVMNEWFRLDDEDIMQFYLVCEGFENMIDALKDNPFFKNPK